MRWTREQYLDLMTFGDAPRPMFTELFGLLVGVDEEWRAQGATDEQIDMTAFDWDYVPIAHVGANTGLRGGEQPVVLEDNDEYMTQRDALGRTMKLFKRSATIPLPLDHPVRSMDDWQRIKPGYEYHDDRIDWHCVEQARAEQAQGALAVAGIPGGFDAPRQLMGEEAACLAYYDQPEMMHDMLATFRDTSVKVLERVSERITIDQLSVHEDFAGKSGPLVGPVQIREFLQPYFRAVWDLLSSRGSRLFDMDTDGNVDSVIEPLLDCGLNGMHPMEPAAGVDIVALRRKHGRRIAFRGGIDKFVLQRGEEAIRTELEHRMQPLMREGGTVFSLDHRIPTGTPLEAYCYYVDLGREMLGLPSLSAGHRGWRRMAF